MNYLQKSNDIVFPRCGLKNIGSTCYINSIIQLLGQCKAHVIYSLEKCPNDSKLLWYYYKDIAEEMWIKGHSLIPLKFLHGIEKTNKFIRVNEQNDVHEICLFILNQLAEEEKKTINDNLTDSFFQLVLTSEIICGHCKNVTKVKEPVYVLEVDLPTTDPPPNMNLSDYIQKQFNLVKFNEDKCWKCDNCNTNTISSKQLVLSSTPQYLFVCLKRFSFYSNASKNTVNIPIPETQMLTVNGNSRSYQLKGMISHLGSIDFGHYITCINESDAYCIYDDLNIRITKDKNSNVLKDIFRNSYICLYTLT
jgi:ubiquitin C-terminal hydrolase